MSCPAPTLLLEFLSGELPDTARSALETHLDECVSCRRAAAVLAEASGGAQTGAPRALPSAGETIGRYAIRGLLGAGAFGVVFRAHDDLLQREVALKLLTAAAGEPEARLEEARTLARVQHPNVVSVLDVGDWRGSTYLVSELVEGSTLASWLDAAPRSTAEILAHCRAAAEGLHAAHAAGVVHRDLKPENILVGTDGRARVADFGLALREGADARTDGFVGTLAYAAPEVLRGGRANARSDQFSLCVVLYEALHCVRPFPGITAAALLQAMERGTFVRQRGRRVPRWVERLLLRGLALDPTARFDSVAELSRALRRRKTTRTLVASAVAGAALSLAAVFISTRPQLTCPPVSALQAEVWNPEAEANVRATLERAAKDSVAVMPEVSTRLTRAARELAEAERRLCVDGAPSAEELARQRQCLSRRRTSLLGVARTLEAISSSTEAELALPITSTFPSAAPCLKPSDAPPVEPPEEGANEGLLQARAEYQLGRYEAALEISRAVLAHAKASQRPWLQLRAQYAVGRALFALERAGPALEALKEAALLAQGLGDDVSTADALEAAFAVTVELKAPEGDYEALRKSADAAMTRLQGRSPELLAGYRVTRGIAANVAGDLSTAETEFVEALRLYRLAFGNEGPRVAKTLHNLGQVYVRLGQTERGLARLEESLRLYEQSYGPEHRKVADVLSSLSAAFTDAERYADAEERATRALRLTERRQGPNSPRAGVLLASLGKIARLRGDFTSALPLLQRAVSLLPLTDASDGRPAARRELVRTLIALGRPREAREVAQGLLLQQEALVGKTHPSLILTLERVGEAALAEGDVAGAVAALHRTRELDPDLVRSPESGWVRFTLAQALERSGEKRQVVLAEARKARAALRPEDRDTPSRLQEIDAWIAERSR